MILTSIRASRSCRRGHCARRLPAQHYPYPLLRFEQELRKSNLRFTAVCPQPGCEGASREQPAGQADQSDHHRAVSPRPTRAAAGSLARCLGRVAQQPRPRREIHPPHHAATTTGSPASRPAPHALPPCCAGCTSSSPSASAGTLSSPPGDGHQTSPRNSPMRRTKSRAGRARGSLEDHTSRMSMGSPARLLTELDCTLSGTTQLSAR